MIATYRAMAAIVDDLLPVAAGDYTSVLFSPGAVGWGLTAPLIADGTEIENKPGAGNGGGQQILHSRVNLAVHPAGFAWAEGTVAGESPTIAELALAANWRWALLCLCPSCDGLGQVAPVFEAAQGDPIRRIVGKHRQARRASFPRVASPWGRLSGLPFA